MADSPDKSDNETEDTPELKGANPAELLGIGASHKDLKTQISQLETALASAEATIDEHKDKALRAYAEVENMRRKALRDIENARKFALEPFVNELLPAIDSLEHAMVAASDADSALIEGLI